MQPCILIPVYDHGGTVGAVVKALEGLGLPCLLVDDGSGPRTRAVLEALAEELPWVELERRPRNGGKGAAVLSGFEAAERRGFSHALAVDADGQHDLRDAPRFLEAARRQPRALVLGVPRFDASAPRARRWGRQISVFFARLETLSRAVRDPLCGFRLYPLAAALAVARGARMGRHMDFDLEILVHLVWSGVPVVNLATAVAYPEGGISHFDPLRDNLRLTRAHARLVLGMLPRARALLRSRPRALPEPER